MSATKSRKSGYSLEDVKAITEYLKAQGAMSFKVGDIEVCFSPGAVSGVSKGVLDDPEMEQQDKLEYIKQTLKAANDDADENLLWST